MFHDVYGSPFLQAAVGLKATDASVRRRPGKDAAHIAAVSRRIAELRSEIEEGGPREAVIRALLYIRMPEGAVDERSFNLLRRMREEAGKGLTLAEFKKLLREQYFMLLLDERHAVDAIPAMLLRDRDLAKRMETGLRRLLEVVETKSKESKSRLAEIDSLLDEAAAAASEPDDEEHRHIAAVRHVRTHTARSSKH
jgi:hypothetical protein